MNANSRQGTLNLDRKKIQGELEQMGYEWRQAAQPVNVTEPGRPSADVWAAVMAAVLTIGYSLRQLLQEGAPAGESTFKRQML